MGMICPLDMICPAGHRRAIQIMERSEKSWRSQIMTPRVNSFAPAVGAAIGRPNELRPAARDLPHGHDLSAGHDLPCGA